MKRGDVVTIALQGDYGKSRPAVIIQSNLFQDTSSVTILPITSYVIDAPLFRILIEPTEKNGLKASSQVMIDKLHTTLRSKIGNLIGYLDSKDMQSIDQALTLFIGIA